MSWHRLHHAIGREWEQLEIALALIEDAKFAMRASFPGASAEERVHFMAVEKLLDHLEKIAKRRMDLHHEVRDAWEWAEGVDEVLRRLKEISELRGGVVGTGFARIPKHLPRFLPGSQPNTLPLDADDVASDSNIPMVGVSPVERDANSIESDETTRSSISKPGNGATAIGRNIARLRRECGWSLDQLSEKTGIDKKSILSHVNSGATPRPSTLKEYAQAFSKALGRTITPLDLEK